MNAVGNGDGTLFMICALPRTGSNLLAGMLDSHPAIKTYNELFHKENYHLIPLAKDLGVEESADPAEISWKRRIWLYAGAAPCDFNEWDWLRAQKPGEFLSRSLLHPAICKDYEAIGCKLQPWQLMKNYSPRQRNNLRKFLKRKKGFRVIFLERDNMLEQFVSNRVAVKLMKWRARSPSDIPRLDERRIEVDAAEFLRYLRANAKKMEMVLDFFKQIPSYRLTYEELTGSTSTATSGIQKFLGVVPQPLTTTDLKINLESLEERISNYGALKQQLAGTVAEKFLN